MSLSSFLVSFLLPKTFPKLIGEEGSIVKRSRAKNLYFYFFIELRSYEC